MSDASTEDRRIDRRQIIRRGAAVGAVAWTAPLLVESLASPAAAATPGGCTPGARLQVIPNQQSVNPNASLAFAVPTTIPVGHSIVVAIACSTAGDPLTTNHTVTDSAGNTYTTHVVVEAGNYGTVYISSAPVTTQLTGGASTVTAHYPTFSGPSSGAVFDFCGTLASLATNSSTGNSTTPSSGFVAAAVGNLVLGGFGYGDNGAAYGGLNAGLANVEGGSTISGRRFQPMWQLISVAGNYAASGTLASGNFWAAAVVNFSVV